MPLYKTPNPARGSVITLIYAKMASVFAVLAFTMIALLQAVNTQLQKFPGFDFDPANALAQLKKSRGLSTANLFGSSNLDGFFGPKDLSNFDPKAALDSIKANFGPPVTVSKSAGKSFVPPDISSIRSSLPKPLDFSSFDFSPKFTDSIWTPLVNLQTKFPQISTDFLNHAFASAATNSSRQFGTTGSSGSPVANSAGSPVIPVASTTGSPSRVTATGQTAAAPVPVPFTAPPPTVSAPDGPTGNSSASLSGLFGRSRPENAQAAKQASTVEQVSKTVSTALNLTNTEIPSALSDVTVTQTQSNCSVEPDTPQLSLTNPFSIDQLAKSDCAKPGPTGDSGLKYRSVNGRCNNIAFPNRGKDSTVFARLLDPDYADGISEPRKSRLKTALPSARLVSSKLIGTKINLAPTWTSMFMQFGQFLDHDLTHTPQTQAGGACCVNGTFNVSLAQTQVHAQCFPIEVLPSDPFYSQFGQKCMDFVRSLPGTRPGCTLGPRDQLNQLSSYIDGNMVYGSTTVQATALRLLNDGLLRSVQPVASNSRYSLLPPDKRNQSCIDGTASSPCFDAGDSRVNIQIALQTIQTMFMRHHNFLCQKLKSINPDWSDEKLYQEARAIVAAQLQHITYNEWLPMLLGTQMTSAKDANSLALLSSGRFTGYNVTVNPAVSNEFATAAFRVGHTMVTGQFSRLHPPSNVTQGVESVRDSFFQSSRLYGENVADEVLLGLIRDKGKQVDNNVATDLSLLLFKRPGQAFGMDLVSLNIQRGRDHGLAGYMKYRKLCGLSTADSFQGIKDLGILPDDVAVQLSSVYESVEDIDLYVAGISEKHIDGGIIGPTFACIIAEQFGRLRRSDRFWYENDLTLPSSLSDAQLAEIRKTTLARIFCDVSSLVLMAQSRVFETASALNPVMSCGDLPQLNFAAWKK